MTMSTSAASTTPIVATTRSGYRVWRGLDLIGQVVLPIVVTPVTRIVFDTIGAQVIVGCPSVFHVAIWPTNLSDCVRVRAAVVDKGNAIATVSVHINRVIRRNLTS